MDDNTKQGEGQIPAGSQTPDITQVLVEATGGAVKGIDDLKGMIGQHQALQAEIEALRAKTSLSPFANEFVQNTNDFFSKGGTMDEYTRFLEAQRMDPDKMSPEELVRFQYQAKYPGLTNEEVDALITKDVGRFRPAKSEDGTEVGPDPAATAELKRRALEAKQLVVEHKAKLGTPAKIVEEKNRQEQQEKLTQAMQSLVSHSVKSLNAIPVSIKDKDVEFGFSFELPNEFMQEAIQAVTPMAIEAFKSGQLSPSQNDFESKTMPTIQEWAKAVAYMKFGPQIVEAAVRDALAKAKKDTVARMSGMRNPQTEPGQRKLDDDAMKALRKMSLGIK